MSWRQQLRKKAFSSAFLEPAKDLEDGDKVILHHSVLERLMQSYARRDMPHPIIFEVANLPRRRKSHCGVLEFSAPEDNVYMPRWMMENLFLSDGDEVVLRPRELKKMTFVRFRPLKYEFTRIPDPKTTLTHALRKFTALTNGDTILVRHGGRDYHVAVTDVKPQDRVPYAASVIDTEVRVEFEEPVEPPPEEAKVALLATGEDAAAEEDVPAEGHAHFSVTLEGGAAARLRLRLEVLSGDPTLFVSCRSRHPDADSHSWKLPAAGELTVGAGDEERAGAATFYVSVHGYRGAARFRLVALEEEEGAAGEAGGAAAGGPAGGNQLRRMTSDNREAGTKRCDNCHAYVPEQRFQMHSLRCARSNWRCDECGEVLRVSQRATHTHCPQCRRGMDSADLQKHLDVVCRRVKCECGAELDAGAAEAHRAQECPLRLVQCSWCTLRVPAREREEHESYCQGRSVPCEVCGAEVSRARMEIHLAVEHNVNPSLARDKFGNQSHPAEADAPRPARAGQDLGGAGDAALNAALAESRAGAGVDGLTPEEQALQRALAASMQQQPDEAAAAASASDRSPSPVSSLHSSAFEDDGWDTPAGGSSQTLGHADDYDDDGFGADGGDDAGSASAADAGAAAAEVCECPFCGFETRGPGRETEIEQHLSESCELARAVM